MATLLDPDGVLDMIAQLYRLTIREALLGDVEAQDFLAICCPDWRELVAQNGIKCRRFGKQPQIIA